MAQSPRAGAAVGVQPACLSVCPLPPFAASPVPRLTRFPVPVPRSGQSCHQACWDDLGPLRGDRRCCWESPAFSVLRVLDRLLLPYQTRLPGGWSTCHPHLHPRTQTRRWVFTFLRAPPALAVIVLSG